MAAVVLLFGPTACVQSPADDTADVGAFVQERFDQQPAGTGLVVGILAGDDRRVLARGVRRAGGADVGKGTLFEIGSITKAFTALALAVRIEQGAVAIDARAAKFLPDSVNVPTRKGRSITLRHLAAQTAGLPRLPPNLDEKHEFADPRDPYAAYSVPRLYRALSATTLTAAPGSTYAYSNFGTGLLGHLLAREAGTSYEALIRQSITAPLNLDATRVALSAKQASRLATGHRPDGTPAPHWHWTEATAGAGRLRSSVRDMLTFLTAQLGRAGAPALLRRAIERSHTILHDRSDQQPVAYGWHVREQDGHTVFWHNGGTGGFRAFAGFSRADEVGVVVLSNVAQPVTETGLKILTAAIANADGGDSE